MNVAFVSFKKGVIMGEIRTKYCDKCKKKLKYDVKNEVSFDGQNSRSGKLDLCNECYSEFLELYSNNKPFVVHLGDAQFNEHGFLSNIG